MMNKRMRWLLLLVVMLVIATAGVSAQEEPPVPPEPTALWEFIGLLFSGGLVTALLQVFRRIKLLSLIPSFLRPVLAGVIGVGVTMLTSYVLANFGIELDLSAVVAFFGVGGGAVALFDIGKEFGILDSRG